MKKCPALILITVLLSLLLSACSYAENIEQDNDIIIKNIYQLSSGDIVIDYISDFAVKAIDITYDSGVNWSNVAFEGNSININYKEIAEKENLLLNIMLRRGAFTDGKKQYNAGGKSNTSSFYPLPPYTKSFNFISLDGLNIDETDDTSPLPLGYQYAVYIKDKKLFIKNIIYLNDSSYKLENIKNNELSVFSESNFSDVLSPKLISAVSQNWVNVLSEGISVENFYPTNLNDKMVVYLFFKIHTTYKNCNYISDIPLSVLVN